MGTAKKTELEASVEQALADLESLSDQIRVKLHLANMDAASAWNEKLEPSGRVAFTVRV